MTQEEQLEVNCKIAGARLEVAEELRKAISILSAWICYMYSSSWIASLAIWLAVELIVPYWYSKQYDQARDAYERATGTGKYFNPISKGAEE